jgi:gliding motility-associated-like protein
MNPFLVFYLSYFMKSQLTSETFSLVLLDQSQNIQRREWYVDSLLQMETGAQLPLDIPMDVDTLELCLVGYRTFCFQKVCKYVPVHRHSLYFPNVFTPDGDINNRFTAIGVSIAEFEMWVYDRCGALMFHTTDMQKGWDGTSGGIKCRQEAYAYTCRYRLKQEQCYQIHTGTVLLLR